MIFHLLILMTLAAGEDNLLANPRFEQDLSGWSAEPSGLAVRPCSVPEGAAVELAVGEEQPVTWNYIRQSVPASPGSRFSATAQCRVEDLRDSVGAALSLTFLNAANERIGHVDQYTPADLQGWTTLSVRGSAPPGAEKAAVMLVLHGRGRAYFRGAELKQYPPRSAQPAANEPVGITVTQEKACPSLIGFGAEDDGWFYNENNRSHGADEAAYALREDRIAWLGPDYIRMFFWYNDWNPSMDAATFTFDNDNMRSHYRTLDLYQRLGARVNITGVEWGIEKPWDNPERLAKAWGSLLEYLIVARGYTCIQDWTLTNEPNLFYAATGQTFERFVQIHRLLKEEFARRGLKVNIVGSDDGNGADWFGRCARDPDYYGAVDLFSSHFYWSVSEAACAGEIFSERVSLIHRDDQTRPFIVGEFGIIDHRMNPPDLNPLMEEYPYALWTQASYIEGLNAGVAGFSVWCMQEVYYPGGVRPMNCGLWNFGDRQWSIRPIYHVIAAFCRNTAPGDPVWRCRTTHPDWVKAAKVGDTLFWVNLSDTAVQVEVQGSIPKSVRILSEDTLAGDRECGVKVEYAGPAGFSAPPRSFGYAQ